MALTVSVDSLAPYGRLSKEHSKTHSSSKSASTEDTTAPPETLRLKANLSFKKGHCTAILGHSGAGKSSLLRCITGLDHYPNAHVQYDNTLYQGDNVFIPPYRRRLGIVFQHHNLFEHLSVMNNLKYAAQRRKNNNEALSLDQAAHLFHIKHLLTKMPNELSGGEKQMVALARTVLTAPKALLLDEPFSNIDVQSKSLMIQSIKETCDNNHIPVIFITHNFSEVAQLADEVVVMEKGSVEANGPLGEITSDLHHSLAKKSNASVVLDALIEDHEEHFGLTKANINGKTIYIKQTAQSIGEHCRIRISAKDVSICLEKPKHSSILNILPVTIEELLPIETTHVLLKLNLNQQHLLSRITQKSYQTLNLTKGQTVFAQIKSVALATDFD